MKKYIAPNAKFICLETEKDMLSLLAGSINEQAEDVDVMSNERERTPSNFIWGDED